MARYNNIALRIMPYLKTIKPSYLFTRLALRFKRGGKSCFAICALLLAGYVLNAQVISDTVGLAKQYRNEGKIKQASSLLNAYCANHPAEINPAWLYAQTLYWLKDFKKSRQIYRAAIKTHPTNYYLQLDYANMLIALSRLKEAKAAVLRYRNFDSTSTGYKSTLTGLYWLDEYHKPLNSLYRSLTITANDTLNKTKQLKNSGFTRHSFRLMKAYYKNHSNDFNTTWVYGQIAYSAYHFTLSKKLYRKAIGSQPGNYYLKLDYAKTLVNMADYKEAKPLLYTYNSYDPQSIEVHLSYAKIHLAEGDYTAAEKEIRYVLAQDNKNTIALNLKAELEAATSSHVTVKANYNLDSQPLQTITPAAEAGIYLHPEATLKLNLQTPLFISNGILKNAQWLQVGDQSVFRKAGLELNADAGIVKQPYANEISWSANIELKEVLLKHLVLQAQFEHKPYYYTLGSLDTVLMVNRYSAYAGCNDLNNWNGRIGFELNQFAGKNYTISVGGWVFTPPLKVSVIEFRIGYAYGFGTAKSNRFEPEKTLAQILNPYNPNAAITGVYSPYFTPNNMSVHSVLASIVAHPVKIFDLGFNANAGFYASALNPYFFLNADENGTTFIDKGYSTEKFTPLEFSAYALVRITKAITLRADYTYRKTYFYTSNNAGLALNINFSNGKKGK